MSGVVAGGVLALGMVPVAVYGPRSGMGQFGTIASTLLIITALCTWSEALLFLPTSPIREHPVATLVGSSVMYLLVAGVLALLAKLLRLGRDTARNADHRKIAAIALLAPVCGIAYVVYYGIFGAITYQWFTRAYYPEATQIVEKLGWWFWGIQFARGVLMTIAVVPIVCTLRMRRFHAAIVVGAVIWIAGGLVPLLMPNPLLTVGQRLIHIAEIFTQNFTLGVTAVLLLRSANARQTAPAAHAVATGT